MAETATALDVAGLVSGYGGSMIVNHVDLCLMPGRILAVVGKNGMGKTTLLKTIMGFVEARRGSIHIFGENVTNTRPHLIARKRVAYVPQEKALFQDLTVEDNLRLSRRENNLFAQDLARVGEFFPFLLERRTQRAGTLSGGEQKMLLAARALMARPRLMLVDEISEGLQPSIITRLGNALGAERERGNIAMVLVEQNLSFALSVADYFAVIKSGEIIDRGSVLDEGAEGRINGELYI